MRVQMKCSCGWVFMVEAGAAGQTVQCPDCGKTLAVPVGADVVSSEAAQVGRRPPVAPPPPGQYMGAPAVAPGTYVARPKPPVGLAVTSMVCGIISLLTWCPCCFMMPLGAILGTTALALGAISLAKKRGGAGMATTGVVTGAIGLLVSLGFLGVLFFGASRTGPAPTPPAPGSMTPPVPFSDGGSDPNQAPPVLTGDEITEALTGPLELPKNAAKASVELRKALRSYPRRGQGTLELYECVQQFRRYLGLADLSVPGDDEHARMFRTAGDELVDIVLADYRKVGQLVQEGDWAQAEKACGKMLEYLPDSSHPLARNVRRQREWCRYRRDNPEDENSDVIPDTFEE